MNEGSPPHPNPLPKGRGSWLRPFRQGRGQFKRSLCPWGEGQGGGASNARCGSPWQWRFRSPGEVDGLEGGGNDEIGAGDHRRLGALRPAGARKQAHGGGCLAMGAALVRCASRRDRRLGRSFHAAPRTGPCPRADGYQLPRQHRRAEARWRNRSRLGLGGWLAARGPAARHLRHRRSIHRPHLRPREELFRQGLRGARGAGRSRKPQACRSPGGGGEG